MAKYTLRSQYGNEIVHTDDERKMQRLLDLKYTLVEPDNKNGGKGDTEGKAKDDKKNGGK